jgi:PleD family two-component response regulator
VVWDGEESEMQLVARADEALYKAKRGGRDRVETA